MPSRPTQLVAYADFTNAPSALFRQYVVDAPEARPFFAGSFDSRGLASAAERTLTLPRARADLARVLAAAQQSRGASRAAERAGELADPRSVAVVTGQQACLFGGPLLVLYKALAVLEVAKRLATERNAPVVPIFWVASTDHDFAEIRSITVRDGAAQGRTLTYTPREEPVGQPAARIPLDDTIVALVDTLAATWPASDARDAALAQIRAAYQPAISVSEAFARLLSVYLPDLVLLDASDPLLARFAVPVVEREISESSPTSRLASATSERLLAAGYHGQVPLRPGFLNLFLYSEGQRRALAVREGVIEVRGTTQQLRVSEALARLHENPADWTPGALLRPLIQDHVLPTAAYVAGPAEIAYHAQIGDCYAHFGIPRPALVPRPSVTLVEPAQARLIESEGLELPALQGNVDTILTAWTQAEHPDLQASFDRARAAVRSTLRDVEQVLGTLDPTLAAACDATVGRALHPIEALHEKVERALKKRDAARGDRLRRAREALFPAGAFQERTLAWVDALARHGPGLIDELRSAIDPQARGHQVFYL
jgi:bacillithiol biosynthesis cysteine-adding enzyme BshC